MEDGVKEDNSPVNCREWREIVEDGVKEDNSPVNCREWRDCGRRGEGR